VEQNNQNFYCLYTPLLHGLSAMQLVQEAFDKRKVKCKLWMPMQKVRKMRYNTEIEVQLPLFPNYILLQVEFIKGMEQEMELALLELKAGYFLKYPGDDLPAIITEEEIKRIEEIEQKEVKETQKEETYTPVEIGTYVEVASSPLMGLKGIVVESTNDTVTIETFVFGRSAPVEVPISVLSRSTPVVPSLSSSNVL
jgi:transcription antitermination factor NusG